MSQVLCLHVQGPLAVHAIHKGERRKETLSWGRALIPVCTLVFQEWKKARICLDLHEQLENRLRGGQLRLWELMGIKIHKGTVQLGHCPSPAGAIFSSKLNINH